MKHKLLSLLISLILILGSIGSVFILPSSIQAAGNPIINGYIAWYNVPDLGSVNLSELTNLIYTGTNVTSASDPTLGTPTNLSTAVTAAHAAGIHIYCTIDSGNSNFAGCVTNHLAQLVTNIQTLVSTYHVDGIDFDWEDVSETQALVTSLVGALHTASPSLPISWTLDWSQIGAPGTTQVLSLATSAYCTWIQVMTYDMSASSYTIGFPYAANYNDSVSIMTAAANYGYPKSKLVMGIPFYGGDNANPILASYGQIYTQLSPSASQDSAVVSTINGFSGPVSVSGGLLVWNSINDVREKTDFIKQNGYGGVMCFELSEDELGNNASLLYNIYQENNSPGNLVSFPITSYTELDGADNNGGNVGVDVYPPRLMGQTFTPSISNIITSFTMELYRVGSPGNITMSIYATTAGKPTGTVLCTASINANSFPTSFTGDIYQTFVFSSGTRLIAGTQYAAVISVPSGNGSGNDVYFVLDTLSHSYAGGTAVYASDGSIWTVESTWDTLFQEWGADNPKAHELTQFPLLVTLLEVGPALIFLLFFGAVMFFLVRLIKVKSTLNIWGMVISTLGFLVMLAMMPSIVNSFYNILSGNF